MNVQNLTLQIYYDPISKDHIINKILKYDPIIIEKYQQQLCAVTWCINPQENQEERGIENTKQFLRVGLDCDVAKEGEKLSKDQLKQKKRLLLNKIKYLPLLPTYIIESKNGYQPVWEFSDPLDLKREDRDRFNENYKFIVKQLCKTTGLTSEGDSISRVLRLPETFHYKDPLDPFKIRLVYEGNNMSRESFSKVYKISSPQEYNQTKQLKIDKNSFELIAKDYGWLGGTLEGLTEKAAWTWRGGEGIGRNNFMKSICASVMFTFIKRGWSIEDGELMCWYLNSKLGSPLKEKEFNQLLKHKVQKATLLAGPAVDSHGWINVEVEQFAKEKKFKVVLPPIQQRIALEVVTETKFPISTTPIVQCVNCKNHFKEDETIVNHHRWCKAPGVYDFRQIFNPL